AAKCFRNMPSIGSADRPLCQSGVASGLSSGGAFGIEPSVPFRRARRRFRRAGKDALHAGGWGTVGFFEEQAVLREIADREGQDAAADAPAELKVGYQGEPGAFGEVAAAAHGGVPVPFASFEKVLDALSQDAIDEAVFPLENAIVGGITEALEPLAASVLHGLDLVATGLTSVPVRLALAAKQGTPIGDVKRAWSHPAALRQCTQRL